jgi:hypothetical protein
VLFSPFGFKAANLEDKQLDNIPGKQFRQPELFPELLY